MTTFVLLIPMFVFPDLQQTKQNLTHTTKKETKIKKTRPTKIWTSINDYGLFMWHTLETELQAGLVCKYCVKEFLESNREAIVHVSVDDFGLSVNSQMSVFECLLQVTCCCGKHTFMVEQPRRKRTEDKKSETSNINEKKKGTSKTYSPYQSLWHQLSCHLLT